MIEHLMSHMNLTRQEGRCLVENFFDELSESLIDGKEVKLSGFGNFELKDKNSRPGRNPKTGISLQYPHAVWLPLKQDKNFIRRLMSVCLIANLLASHCLKRLRACFISELLREYTSAYLH